MKVLLNCGRTNQVENTSQPIMETRMIAQKKNSENFENFIFTGENSRKMWANFRKISLFSIS